MECEEKGSEAMLSKLRAIDPDYAASLHPNNVKRIIRALEIYYSTGENMSSALKNQYRSRLNMNRFLSG